MGQATRLPCKAAFPALPAVEGELPRHTSLEAASGQIGAYPFLASWARLGTQEAEEASFP